MRVLGREVSVPSLVLAGLAIAIAVAIVIGAATTGAAFAPFNTDWQGAADLRATAADAGAEPDVATEIDRYDAVAADETVAFVLAPANRSASDHERMRGFVERGGRLVVATDDPGAGNALLEGIDVDVRVAGAPLRDDVEFLHGPGFPTATTTANHSAVQNASGLALNYGTALEVGDDTRPIANSSSFSYLDRDGDGAPSPGESLQARPIVASQSVGDGEVIVVADPSVFINAMLEHEPNHRFAENLVADREQAMLDQADSGIPPLRAAVLWLRGHPIGPALLGVVLVGLVVAWERGLFGWIWTASRRRLPGERAADGSDPGLGGIMTDDGQGGDDATVD